MVTWERWNNFRLKRVCVSRNSHGQFVKGNFHFPKNWLVKNPKKKEETKKKISNTLKGVKFTEERKKNISIGTKKANYKWSKGCKHGIVPISSCRECMNERLREWRKKKK